VNVVARVGIFPAAELNSRPLLFAALRAAFPQAEFEAREAGSWSGLDALIELGGGAEAAAAAAAGVRALAAEGTEAGAGTLLEYEVSAADGVDRRLRGRVLGDKHLAGARLEKADGEVLARAGGAPVWTRAGLLDRVAVTPEELAAAEPLRSRLGRYRSLALLPLIELLRSLGTDGGWRPPAVRAAFVLDDPNLHWPSYGYLSLPRLADHADRHGYHLGLAMVPLDARLAHPTAASLLRRRGSLSLLVHGNDHFGAELGRAASEAEAMAVAAQAQRRVDAFERRTGIAISRVMVPPHEACSEAMAHALVRTGFDAITMTRPYPWIESPSWLGSPPGLGPLAGWRPADTAPGLPPVFLRHPLAAPLYTPAEVTLRAYLDQPLVLYGHHDDLRDGLEPLAERAADVARLGDVSWSSLADIAAANYSAREDGELLRLRPHSRRLAVEVPAGATHAVVEPDGLEPGEAVRTATARTLVGEPFPVSGGGQLQLTLESPHAVSPTRFRPPPQRFRRVARRLAGEARDRATPALGRLPRRR
jgi:hypothetical protein